MRINKVLGGGGGVEWLCHCPRGCLQKVSWWGSVAVSLSTKSVLGGLSGYVNVLGGVYK